MDKNKETTFDVPAADIQDKITLLMGLPAEEASARLDKSAPPKRIGGTIIRQPAPSVEHVKDRISDEETPTQNGNAPEDTIVDDIVRQESDELLENDDDKQKFVIEPKKPKGIKRILTAWWNHTAIRSATIISLIAIIVLAILIPQSRYIVLNTVGVRASMSFRVIDKSTSRPVKNVNVVIANQSAATNEQGLAELTNLPLGPATVQLQKRSFEAVSVPLTIGWGSNPIDAPFELTPTGTTFSFTVVDWLSGLPIKNAEVSDGESTAITDNKGQANLIIEPTDDDIPISFLAENYRQENRTIAARDTQGKTVPMVPSIPNMYVSKRSGKYDIYTKYIDGSNETIILPGTGAEQPDIHILQKPQNTLAAIVSSREGKRNKEGYLLSNVYILDSFTKQVNIIPGTESERIRLIGWTGDSILFVKTIAGPSGYTGNRQRIVSHNVKTSQSIELASANYITDVRVIKDMVYYVLSQSDGSQSKGLTQIKPDGKDKRVLVAKNIWAVYRTSYDQLYVNAEADEWYEVTLSSSSVTKKDGSPADIQNLVFAQSPYSQKAAWIEERDGKSVLLVRDESGKETVVLQQSGATYPIKWLNDTTIVFTVKTSQESADYVVHIPSKTVKKIADVTVSVYTDATFYY